MLNSSDIEYFKGIGYIKIAGSENKPQDLIFLPGIGMSILNYLDLLNELKGHYTSIYGICLPEQGSEGEWGIGNTVDILYEFIANFKLTKIDMMGHSAGAVSCIFFLLGINSKLENLFIKENQDQPQHTFINNYTNETISKTEAGNFSIGRITLLAPPSSFNTVFPKKYVKTFRKASNRQIRRLLNITVNYPMYLLSFFSSNAVRLLHRPNECSYRYFALKIKDGNRFLEYLINYADAKEYLQKLKEFSSNTTIGERHSKSFDFYNKIPKTLIYGTNDWLIKPWRNKGKDFQQFVKIVNPKNAIKINGLGHMLKYHNTLDINMSSQICTNKKVIEFIKKELV